MRLVATQSNKINFKGIFITGWQRYDHFAVLCELLPVGLPSLAVNLAFLAQSDLSKFIISNKLRLLYYYVVHFLNQTI